MDDDEALAARDRRIEKVSRQHRIVLCREGDDDGGIFGALRFVDRDRIIGWKQRIEFAKGILDLTFQGAGQVWALVGS